MNIKPILSITGAALALIAFIPAAHAYQGTRPTTTTATLLYPNGKPAIDATVIEDIINPYTHDIITTSFKPDSKGNVILAFPCHLRDSKLVFYTVSPTSMGFFSLGDQYTPVTSTLQAFTSVRIHLVDAGGHPVAHAQVCPSGFNMMIDNLYGAWNESIPGPWSSTTDNNGYATLNKLPQGMVLRLRVHDDQFTLPHGYTNIRLSNESSTPDVTVQLNPAGSISGIVVFATSGKPAQGIQVVAKGHAGDMVAQPVLTDKDGKYTLTGLTDDTYQVGQYKIGEINNDWAAIPQSVVLSQGAHVNSINLALIHGVIVTGKVTDKITGKPISDVVIYTGTLQDSPTLRETTYRLTGPDGTYTVRLVPGKTTIEPITPWDRPDMNARDLDTKDGDTKTMDFQVMSPVLPTVVHGIVLGPGGQPAPNATVIAWDQNENPQVVTADALGHFILDAPGLEPNGKILARSGGLCTQNAFIYAPDKPVTLQLAATGVCTIKGQINDSDGNPIANANILLLYLTDTSGAVIDQAFSNAQGQYAFAPVFGNIKYSVSAWTPGHSPTNSNAATGTADQALEIPPLIAVIADAVLGGTVVDSKGNPVANADVSDDVISTAHSTSDKAGHFVLTGAPRGKTNIYALAPDGTTGFGPATSGRGDNVIYLKNNP